MSEISAEVLYNVSKHVGDKELQTTLRTYRLVRPGPLGPLYIHYAAELAIPDELHAGCIAHDVDVGLFLSHVIRRPLRLFKDIDEQVVHTLMNSLEQTKKESAAEKEKMRQRIEILEAALHARGIPLPP